MALFSLLALPVVLLYLLPSWLALSIRHPSQAGIFRLNLLLGWTLLGWILAGVWAFCHPETLKMKRV